MYNNFKWLHLWLGAPRAVFSPVFSARRQDLPFQICSAFGRDCFARIRPILKCSFPADPKEGEASKKRPDASNHRKMTLWPRSAVAATPVTLNHAQQSGS